MSASNKFSCVFVLGLLVCAAGCAADAGPSETSATDEAHVESTSAALAANGFFQWEQGRGPMILADAATNFCYLVGIGGPLPWSGSGITLSVVNGSWQLGGTGFMVGPYARAS